VRFDSCILLQHNNRGYVRCTLTPERLPVRDDSQAPQALAMTPATFAIESGRAGAHRAGV
jgi:hypothetical protein